MLSQADLEEIRQGLQAGFRGPILVKWCRLLLADRDELAARLRTMQATRGEVPSPRNGKWHAGRP